MEPAAETFNLQQETKFMETRLVATILLKALLCTSLATGADAPVPATTASTAPTPDYHPSMSDLMTMTVQPRHIKLGLAGQYKNWPYAAYALGELRGAFTRVARTIPVYSSTDTAALNAAMVQGPISELDKAIKATDSAQFSAAYQRLTEACNACHVLQNKATVVIKVPDATMFPDQEFRPINR